MPKKIRNESKRENFKTNKKEKFQKEQKGRLWCNPNTSNGNSQMARPKDERRRRLVNHRVSNYST